MTPLPTLAEIESIAATIDAVVPRTPQFTWPLLNERAGTEVWVKHENHTAIGSFKIRGALHYVTRLVARDPGARGLIAATRGNFGQAVAFAARRHGLTATIIVPRGNSVEKNRAMQALGAELIEHGDDFQAAFEESNRLAARRELHAMPPFHRDLVEGIAVSALDFLRHSPPLDTVYAPIGMGSGVCALMAARDALRLPTKIIGVASAGAPAIALSFAARRALVHPAATRIADGVACSTPDPAALAHMLHGLARLVTVSDDETEAAIRAYFADIHNVAEGAAGIALAALLRECTTQHGHRVGVVLTGGNIDASVFQRVLADA